ncbi:hypothetical protein UT300007_02580 [Clostridium sp. CTA-7]
MKKYLNEGLFYQGDAKIILPLTIAYIGAFLFNKMIISEFFTWTIRQKLYNNNMNQLIYPFVGIVTLILYLIVIYTISVGIFKRKKWSTLLAGPFSRMDIRKRELCIVVMSNFVYILIYLVIVGQGIIENMEIISYIGNFKEIIIIDLIRIISISIITIGGLALLDSIFSNIYYLIGSMIFIGVYIISLLINFQLGSFTYIDSTDTSGVRYVYNGLTEYLQGVAIGNKISSLQITCISLSFIITGIILILIAKKLTNKMLVEHMNEGIIFNFPKKVVQFMLVTFLGVLFAPILSNLINEFYFYYTLGNLEIIFIRIGIIVISSILSYLLLIKFKKRKKHNYYNI